MTQFENLNLKMENGKCLHVNLEYLQKYKDDILSFLDGEVYMQSLRFAKSTMLSDEIKTNNEIEGMNDNILEIHEVTHNKNSVSKEKRRRIINLYRGYNYILSHDTINKDTLKELYLILSKELVDNIGMGEYYRLEEEYILTRKTYEYDKYKGVNEHDLEEYMNYFFEYVNQEEENNDIDKFIKSQIMHFYFVYIHPYFDINGRTSRTVAMWYLLNNNCFPYIIFNRAISFNRKDYLSNILKVRTDGDITLFLKYMLENVLIELEKEYVIHSIKDKSKLDLSKEELLIIRYLITMKEHLTVKDLSTIYNHYNEKRSPSDIYLEKIKPLLDKNIFQEFGKTKRDVSPNLPNYMLRINPILLELEPLKVKHLHLNKFNK